MSNNHNLPFHTTPPHPPQDCPSRGTPTFRLWKHTGPDNDPRDGEREWSNGAHTPNSGNPQTEEELNEQQAIEYALGEAGGGQELEDHLAQVWIMYEVDREDRRAAIRDKAIHIVTDVLEKANQGVDEHLGKIVEMTTNAALRIARRYKELRDNKGSRAATPMSAALFTSPSIIPTASVMSAQSRTDNRGKSKGVVIMSPHLEGAQEQLKGPQQAGESDEQFARRQAALQRIYGQANQSYIRMPQDANIIEPPQNRRVGRADKLEDQVAYQKMRNEMLKKEGSSYIDDHGIIFEGHRPVEDKGIVLPITNYSKHILNPIPTPINTQAPPNAKYNNWPETLPEPTTTRIQTVAPIKNEEHAPSIGRNRMLRGFSMPCVNVPTASPGVQEAQRSHKAEMEERLSKLIHENLAVRVTYPDGFKYNQKLNARPEDKYSRSAKFADLEDWLSSLCYKLAVRQLGGSELDRACRMILMEHLSGDALKWYIRHVTSVKRTRFDWTFETIVLGLYVRFVHPSTMQDTREGFKKTRYTPSMGVQGFYDTILEFAQCMAIYPDEYSILEVFLDGLPDDMRTHLIQKNGLSPEVNSLEDFRAYAIQYETRENMYDYYCQHARCDTISQTTPVGSCSGDKPELRLVQYRDRLMVPRSASTLTGAKTGGTTVSAPPTESGIEEVDENVGKAKQKWEDESTEWEVLEEWYESE